MAVHYTAAANLIVVVHQNGEERKAAQVNGASKETAAATAKKAAELLNRARYLNNVKRRYTDAARKIAAAEALPGFTWVENPLTSVD